MTNKNLIIAEKHQKVFVEKIGGYDFICIDEALTVNPADYDSIKITADSTVKIREHLSVCKNLKYKKSRNLFEWGRPIEEIKEDIDKLYLYKKEEEKEVIEYAPQVPIENDMDFEDIPLSEQVDIIEKIIRGRKISASSLASLSAIATGICKQHKLFVRDIITGNLNSVLSKKQFINKKMAQNLFYTHFIDRLYITRVIKGKDEEDTDVKKYVPLRKHELDIVWENICQHSTYNSRKVFYNNIPEWDGKERIRTFLKDYFECDANPNFFLLLMTCIVGMLVNPSKYYCPWFFDFVSPSKGIGKSLLCRRLLGNKYCAFLNFSSGRSEDDFFVNAYDGNNILIVDDECTWCGKGRGKISYDYFKMLVTNPTDKFSRKNMQPEEHDRCFIILRTSNDVNQVYSTNERRQIIFKLGLPENECRILSLPDSFFEQMLAEAIDYFNKNGVYKMTDQDWENIKDTNLENYNMETEENIAILEYIEDCRRQPVFYGTELQGEIYKERIFGGWAEYISWATQNKYIKIPSRQFWRSITALSQYKEHGISYSGVKKKKKNGTMVTVFEIHRREV